MAIIKCPECGHQISEKAPVCPICGIGIAGHVVRCIHCGEVYLKADGLCPNCHRSNKTFAIDDDEMHDDEQGPTAVAEVSGTEESTPTSGDGEAGTTRPDDDTDMADQAESQQRTDEGADAHVDDEDSQQATTSETTPADDAPDGYIDEEQVFGDDETPAEEGEQEETATAETGTHKSIMPYAVSLGITALIAAVCLYFYNESKNTRETADLNAALNSGTRDALYNFIRTHPDASEAARKTANDKLNEMAKQEQDEALTMTSRDKGVLLDFIARYPDHPKKAQMLRTIDSIDWEDALRANNKEAYEKYLAEHAEGLFAGDAKDKVSVKVLTATEEDKAMATQLFRGFFLGVNGKDASRLTQSMGEKMTQFMGTENVGRDGVTAWMNQQHEGIQTVTWKLDHSSYDIKKKEQNGQRDYTITFTAKRTLIHNDGRATTENFKITSTVDGNNKITSMNMEKYTPTATPASSTAAPAASSSTAAPANKPATSASSTSAAAPAKKPATSASTTSAATPAKKPATSASSTSAAAPAKKPATSASSTSAAAPAKKPESGKK